MTQAFNKACNEYADAMKRIREVCIETLTEICNRRDDKIIDLTKLYEYCKWTGNGYPVIEYEDHYSEVKRFYIKNNRLIFDIEYDDSYLYFGYTVYDDLLTEDYKKNLKVMKACFMGLGYIGLPTAIIAAKHGIQVHGVDINPKVVEKTNQGILHIIEPGMEELLQEVIANGKFHAATTPIESDAYFMVVPTPFKGDHQPDVSYVEAATRAVLPLLKEGDLYVIESTSPVGTTEMMANLIFTERPELKDKIYIAYCPERVLPGNVIYELVHNDRVIGGINTESTEKAIEF